MTWPIVEVRAAQESSSVLTPEQANGVKVLIIVSAISLVAVVFLFFIIVFAALKARIYKSSTSTFRSHVTLYLMSLLVSDILQAIGSIMNAKWVQSMAVSVGNYCTVQGAIKQAADVGTALWISVIAVHTFSVLVLEIHIRKFFMYVVLASGWSFIGVVVTIGPFILQNSSKGPYFGISGFWCWISEPYTRERVVLGYMMMFLSGFISFVLYVLVFLRLRRNLVTTAGGRVRFQSTDRVGAWKLHQTREASDLQAYIVTVAKHMLLYPIAYIILIVPISACRFSEWAGHHVPLGAIIFSDSVFLLSGLVNVLLFVLTGRVLPLREILEVIQFPLSRSGRKAVEPGLPVATAWDRETKTAHTMSSSSSLASSDELDRTFEKELPKLPHESHSTLSRTPRTISIGRRSDVFSGSETTSLVRQGL